MNEGKKTAIFAAIAGTSLLLAYITQPRAATSERAEIDEKINTAVFAGTFTDPANAASLEITNYDETLGTLKSFEIAKDKTTNLWKIPSHDDYPADAAEQVRDATTPLCDLKILAIASTDRGEHSYYGVVEPDSKKLKVGDTGVGMMITVKNEAGVVVAGLIVGKQDAKNENRRFVRVPNQDPVYVADLTTTPFTTDFKKWIKGDLLEVKSFDITSVGIRDYAIVRTQGGGTMSRSFDADLAYEPSGSKWNLVKLVGYETGQPQEVKLAEDEELKSDKLNDLRNALQSLEIADVVRKPKGLAADLKADASLLANNESLMSLFNQGFIPQKGANDTTEIFATGGETLIGTQDGVQYTLRFGESLTKMAGTEPKEAGTQESDSGLQRYLLVTTSLDDSKFPLPDLQPVPETIEDLLKLEAADAPAQPPAAPVTSEPAPSPSTEERPPAPSPKSEPAVEKSEPTVAEPAAAKSEDAPPKPAENAAENAPAPPAKAEPKSEDEIETCGPQPPDEQATKTETPVSDPAPTPAETPKAQEPVAESTPPATAETKAADKPASTDEELKERLEAARERITKENQRKIDQRNEKLDAARKKVQELNARFSDWYYVVSDSVYKKLKLSREELIAKKGAGSTAAPIDAGAPPAFPGIPGLPQP